MTDIHNGSATVMRCQDQCDPTEVAPDFVVRRPITDLLREALDIGRDLLEARHPGYAAVDKRGEHLAAGDDDNAFGHAAKLLVQAIDFERHAAHLRGIADRCGWMAGTSTAHRALVDAALRYHNPLSADRPQMLDLVALAEAAAQEGRNV